MARHHRREIGRERRLRALRWLGRTAEERRALHQPITVPVSRARARRAHQSGAFEEFGRHVLARLDFAGEPVAP
jgi:hypothetical protein